MKRNQSGFIVLGFVAVLAWSGVAAAGDSSGGCPNGTAAGEDCSGGCLDSAACSDRESECCQPCPEYCQPCYSLVGGAEGTFLRATRAPSPNSVSASPPSTTLGGSDFNSFDGTGVRGWLGVEGPRGWGIRGRYWDFTDDHDFAVNSPSATTSGTCGLRAYTVDLEVTKDIDLDPWAIQAAFGGRYGRMEQNQTIAAQDGTGESSNASALRFVSGTGITGMLEGRRALGDSNWNFFANVRGSVLWGNDIGRGWASASAVSSDSEAIAQSSEGPNSVFATVYILETQIGAEWTHPLQSMRGTLFVRAAYEFQRWTTNSAQGQGGGSTANAGAANHSYAFASAANHSTANASAGDYTAAQVNAVNYSNAAAWAGNPAGGVHASASTISNALNANVDFNGLVFAVGLRY